MQIKLVQRTASNLSYQWRSGLEPGVNVKVDSFASIPIQSTIVESSADTLTCLDYNNEGLITAIKAPRPTWSKVRWINCYGTCLFQLSSWRGITVPKTYRHELGCHSITRFKAR